MATTYSVSSGDYIRPYKCRPRIQHFPMAATQTFVKGEPLIMDAASTENRVKVAANQPTTLLVGFAAAAAADCLNSDGTTAGALVPVWCCEANMQFKAVGKAAQALDYTDLSVGLALLKDATNVIWYIDNTDTTHDAVVPLTIIAPAVQGDFQGYYSFKIAAAASLWTATV